MSISNYPSNSASNKRRPEKPKIEKIVTGEVKTRKRPLGLRIWEAIQGEDIPTTGTHLFYEVIIPGIRDIIYDAITGGVGQVLGVNSRRRATTLRGKSTIVPYESFSKNTSIQAARIDPSPIGVKRHRGEDYFVLSTRAEAEEVLDQMRALLDQYESVTVADVKSYLGVKVEVTDDVWGWRDLREARITNERDGYVLDMPRTIEIR